MKGLIAALSLSLLVPAAPLAAAQPQAYLVRLYSFGFQPQPIFLRAGVPVTLVFTNTAGIGHEFKSPGFFRSARIMNGPVDSQGAVELRPHQSLSVTLVPARGAYQVHCGHFMHAQMGMQTWIYVE